MASNTDDSKYGPEVGGSLDGDDNSTGEMPGEQLATSDADSTPLPDLAIVTPPDTDPSSVQLPPSSPPTQTDTQHPATPPRQAPEQVETSQQTASSTRTSISPTVRSSLRPPLSDYVALVENQVGQVGPPGAGSRGPSTAESGHPPNRFKSPLPDRTRRVNQTVSEERAPTGRPHNMNDHDATPAPLQTTQQTLATDTATQHPDASTGSNAARNPDSSSDVTLADFPHPPTQVPWPPRTASPATQWLNDVFPDEVPILERPTQAPRAIDIAPMAVIRAQRPLPPPTTYTTAPTQSSNAAHHDSNQTSTLTSIAQVNAFSPFTRHQQMRESLRPLNPQAAPFVPTGPPVNVPPHRRSGEEHATSTGGAAATNAGVAVQDTQTPPQRNGNDGTEERKDGDKESEDEGDDYPVRRRQTAFFPRDWICRDMP